MSKQKFTTRERQAFWIVYGKKCFYDGVELLLKEVELDHVVPEDFLTLAEEDRTQQLSTLGLPETYDICAYENIVVSCGACNGQKGKLQLYPQQICIALARAKENAPKVREIINRREKAASKEALFMGVMAAIDAGHVTGPEIVEHLRGHGRLGFLTNARPPVSNHHSNSGVLFSDRAAKDLQRLGMRLTLEEIVRIIGSDATHVYREAAIDGHLITEMRNGDMYFKFRKQGERILVLSAHVTA